MVGRREKGTVYPFRFARIATLEALAATFEYPSGDAYDAERLFESNFGIFVSEKYSVEDIELELDRRWETYAQTHCWHPSQRVSIDRNKVLVTLRTRLCPELKAWILGFGGDATVRAPVALRQEIINELERGLQNYSKPGEERQDVILTKAGFCDIITASRTNSFEHEFMRHLTRTGLTTQSLWFLYCLAYCTKEQVAAFTGQTVDAVGSLLRRSKLQRGYPSEDLEKYILAKLVIGLGLKPSDEVVPYRITELRRILRAAVTGGLVDWVTVNSIGIDTIIFAEDPFPRVHITPLVAEAIPSLS